MIERKFLEDSVKKIFARDFIKAEYERAGVVDVDIQRTTLGTRVKIVAERPGIIIGSKGAGLIDLSRKLEEMGFEAPKIEVEDVKNSDLEPVVMGRYIKRMLERGIKPRRAVMKALNRIMRAGAIGAEIIVSGKFKGGGAKARVLRIADGYLKKAGEQTKLVKSAHVAALLKQGVIGITVKIVPPDALFTDKMLQKSIEGEGVEKGEGTESTGQ